MTGQKPWAIALGDLVRGTFLRRDNRFRVQVRVNVPGKAGHIAAAHLANPGRLTELLVPGRPVWLTPASNPRRRTAYSLSLIEHQHHLVSLNTHLPNRLVGAALHHGRIPGFADYAVVQSERSLGESRLDFRLSDPGVCWIEVKSVTLMMGQVARFPDAPTARGRRHLRALARACAEGERAAVFFVVQREDAQRFAPHDATDPAFGTALREAAADGVEVRAFRCHVTPSFVQLAEAIPVHLG